MKELKITISCMLILVLSFGVSYAQDTILYGAVRDNCGDDVPADGSLYTIDPNTGQAQIVGGPIGFEGVSAMVFLNDGRLVASATDDDNGDKRSILIEIDTTTGQGTFIGLIGDETVSGECGRVPGLTYDRTTDTLYGLGIQCNPVNRGLLEINPNTAQAIVMGPTGINGGGNGLAINMQGVLFSTPSPPANEVLVTINPDTGMATEVAQFDGFPRINSLDFHPVTGVLFGADINNNTDEFELITINTANAAITVIGDLPSCIDGLAFTPAGISQVPTLSEWGLVAMACILGIAGFMVIRRRKMTA